MTGHIRFAENPNKRTQDGIKAEFLCAECEKFFNSFETPFATKVFHPYQENGNQRIGYREWLLKFCVSLSWRSLRLLIERGNIAPLPDAHWLAIESAERVWAKFLLGEITNPGEHEQHLLPLDLIETNAIPDMPDNINRYLMRTVEFDFASAEHSSYVYTKIGPFALFGFVKKPEEKWIGSKIHVKAGYIEPKRYRLPLSVMHYLFSRARNYASVTEKISEIQHKKIERTLLDNIDRAVQSDQMKAMLRDAEMFGEQAIIRIPKE